MAQTDDNIAYIRQTLNDLEKFCRENGFKCSFSVGGGTEYSGGIMEWDDISKSFNQITKQEVRREYCNMMFRVTTKDTDYGDEVNPLKEVADGLNSFFKGLPKSEDFESHE